MHNKQDMDIVVLKKSLNSFALLFGNLWGKAFFKSKKFITKS